MCNSRAAKNKLKMKFVTLLSLLILWYSGGGRSSSPVGVQRTCHFPCSSRHGRLISRVSKYHCHGSHVKRRRGATGKKTKKG